MHKKMHSEEVIKLNVALRYCDQLKNNLQASILHVQMLNRKYNTVDYTQLFSTSISGIPEGNRSTMKSQHIDDHHDQPSIIKKQIRSIGYIKHNFNNIIVNGIKLRREVETTSTKLKLLGKEHRSESPYMVKKRMQCVNHISHASPSSSGCSRHGRCFQNSPDRNVSRDRSRDASAKKTYQSFNTSSIHQHRTPPPPPSSSSSSPSSSQRKRTRKSSLHNQLVDVQSSIESDVKKSRFQSSTPMKINESTTTNSLTNRSYRPQYDVVMNSNCCLSKLIADDDDDVAIMNSPIKPCFRNASDERPVNNSPKRICWTPIVKVKRISIYQ